MIKKGIKIIEKHLCTLDAIILRRMLAMYLCRGREKTADNFILQGVPLSQFLVKSFVGSITAVVPLRLYQKFYKQTTFKKK